MLPRAPMNGQRICGKPKIKCGECPHQAFIPVSDEIIEKHLRGGGNPRPPPASSLLASILAAGRYLLVPSGRFRRRNLGSRRVGHDRHVPSNGIPAALERSRSGNGGHVWIFFSEAIPARTARQLGAAIVTETMDRRPEIGFSSYDRFFPSQDTMPIGGFGNLIALPLQRRARETGDSVFIDSDLRPYHDQWAFLSSFPRVAAIAASQIVADAETRGRVVGVRMPVEDEKADEPWRLTPSRRREPNRSAPLAETRSALSSPIRFISIGPECRPR